MLSTINSFLIFDFFFIAGIGDTSAKNAMVLVSTRSEINEVFDQFGHQHGSVGETKHTPQTTPKVVHPPPPRPPPVRPAPVRPPPVNTNAATAAPAAAAAAAAAAPAAPEVKRDMFASIHLESILLET